VLEHDVEQEALVRSNRARESGPEGLPLLAQATPGQVGERRGLGLAGYESGDDRWARRAADLLRHQGEFDAGSLEDLADPVELTRALADE
jgi:hypothetical protein